MKARLWLAGVFALTLATTGISVGFNFLGRDFYNALASECASTMSLLQCQSARRNSMFPLCPNGSPCKSQRGELSESFEIMSESIGLRLRLDRAKS